MLLQNNSYQHMTTWRNLSAVCHIYDDIEGAGALEHVDKVDQAVATYIAMNVKQKMVTDFFK